jgi:hypothetical protein
LCEGVFTPGMGYVRWLAAVKSVKEKEDYENQSK